MSRRRLFVEAERLGAAERLGDRRLVLTGDEHRHVARVLRARPGEALTLFDGAGGEVEATIVAVGAREVELTLGERRAAPAAAPAVAVTLLVAVPRGERMDWLVQKTTELGVTRIVPVSSERPVARPEAGSGRRPRWEKIAREAARQCGRADVPRIEEPTELAAALADPALPARRLALWEGERANGRSLGEALAADAAAPAAILVGPEGGFAAEEVVEAAKAGFAAVGLGPRILRVETAAVVAVALAQEAAGGLGGGAGD
jgi:16S rRNA (uracil1498-N3)-methyltransferase